MANGRAAKNGSELGLLRKRIQRPFTSFHSWHRSKAWRFPSWTITHLPFIYFLSFNRGERRTVWCWLFSVSFLWFAKFLLSASPDSKYRNIRQTRRTIFLLPLFKTGTSQKLAGQFPILIAPNRFPMKTLRMLRVPSFDSPATNHQLWIAGYDSNENKGVRSCRQENYLAHNPKNIFTLSRMVHLAVADLD